jgi:hypothetical protein
MSFNSIQTQSSKQLGALLLLLLLLLNATAPTSTGLILCPPASQHNTQHSTAQRL